MYEAVIAFGDQPLGAAQAPVAGREHNGDQYGADCDRGRSFILETFG